MNKPAAWGALVLAAASAFAAPAFAHDDHRDHDRGAYGHREDHGRHNHRWDDGDDWRRDRRWDDRDDWRHDARHHDRRAHVPRVYRPTYVYVVPRGYAVQRWRVGTRMPPPFYASRYYLDPYAYRLPPPPRGYRWVRVDRDAYLVAVTSGLIADVLYGLFR